MYSNQVIVLSVGIFTTFYWSTTALSEKIKNMKLAVVSNTPLTFPAKLSSNILLEAYSLSSSKWFNCNTKLTFQHQILPFIPLVSGLGVKLHKYVRINIGKCIYSRRLKWCINDTLTSTVSVLEYLVKLWCVGFMTVICTKAFGFRSRGAVTSSLHADRKCRKEV